MGFLQFEYDVPRCSPLVICPDWLFSEIPGCVLWDLPLSLENSQPSLLQMFLLLISLFQRSFFTGGLLFLFFFASLLANLEEFSCKLSNSFPEMHANFVKFFQDTSKFQEMYSLCIFKKEFAK